MSTELLLIGLLFLAFRKKKPAATGGHVNSVGDVILATGQILKAGSAAYNAWVKEHPSGVDDTATHYDASDYGPDASMNSHANPPASDYGPDASMNSHDGINDGGEEWTGADDPAPGNRADIDPMNNTDGPDSPNDPGDGSDTRLFDDGDGQYS